jgi:hypothetical protein
MDKGKGAKPRANGWRSLLEKAWIDLVLLALAVAALAVGFYLRSQPDWTLREDIKALNLGITAFHEPPGILPAGDGRPSEYPIERAAAHWDRVTTITADPTLKSLAYYNGGTLVGREVYAFKDLPNPPQIDLAEGIRKLGEALRADPSSEDAKFNLELLLRVKKEQGMQEGAPGPGYSPGAVQKGY